MWHEKENEQIEFNIEYNRVSPEFTKYLKNNILMT